MPENVSPSRVYKTQLDAVAYLKDAGYKCSKSQFNRDVKARKVPRTPEGWFDETALLGYANANLTPAGQVADRQLADATTSRLSADAQLKRYQAERARLKLEKEQGLLMSNDTSAVEAAADEVIAANEKAVNEYRSGSEKVFGFLMGQMCRKLGKSANPAVIKTVLTQKLKG